MMDSPIDFSACLSCVCLTARRRAQELTRAFDDRLRQHGLTINQFSMLAMLAAAGPMPLSRLAGMLGIDRTTLTRNAGLCRQRGLLEFRRGEDARERVVALTLMGRNAARDAYPAWEEGQARALREKE